MRFNLGGFLAKAKTGLALLVAITLMSTGAITSAQAEGGYCFRYDVRGDYAAIEYASACKGELIIPSTIEGRPVTRIDEYSFDNSSVTALTIPSTVTDIDDEAFEENRFLKSFTVTGSHYSTVGGVLYNFDKTLLIAYPSARANHAFTTPSTVTRITGYAFQNAQHLRELTLNEGLTQIGSYAFAYSEHLASLTIPSTLISIPVNPFYDVDTMKTIRVSPASTTLKVVEGALLTKDGKVLISYPAKSTATSYAVPAGVEYIASTAFADNQNLQTVTLPNSLVAIGNEAFRDAKALTSISIPAAVTTIGGEAFRRVATLASITIPSDSKLEAIEYRAFSGTGLTAFHFPAEVWQIDSSVFIDTPITGFTVSPANDSYEAVDGVVLTEDRSALTVYPSGRVGSYSIPNTVSEIPYEFFAGAEGLTSVVIPASVTYIHESAFFGSGITTVDFEPDSQLRTINSYAFASTKLTSITIPASVDTIGNFIFEDTSLNSIGVNPDNPYFESVDGVLFTEGISQLIRYPSNNMNTTYSIPDTVVEVREGAFGENRFLESLAIPAATTNFSGAALLGEQSLKIITVDSENIEYAAIDGVLFNVAQTVIYHYPSEKADTEFSIPSSTEIIAGDAFADAKYLEKLNLSEKSRNIMSAGFDLNQSIETFTVHPSNTVLASVDGVIFTKDLTKIMAYPPARTGPYTIPNSVMSIDDDAFQRNSKVSEITVPGSVEIIAGNTFRDLAELTKITFKASAAEQVFHRSVFRDSEKLTTVIFEGKAPSTIQSDAFASQPTLRISYPINEPTWTLAKLTTPFSSVTMVAVDPKVKYAPTSVASTKASVKGTAKVGKLVTANKGKFAGSATITYKYQWFKCGTKAAAAVVATKTPAKCVAIAKATASSFKVTSAQKGSYARVRITAKNSTNSVTVFSASSAKIN